MNVKYGAYVEFTKNNKLFSTMIGKFDIDKLGKRDKASWKEYQETSSNPDDIIDPKVIDLYFGYDLTTDDHTVHRDAIGFNDNWGIEVGHVFDTLEEAKRIFYAEKYKMIRGIFYED